MALSSVLWVMLNPATADEHVLDPTLRRCEGFSKRFGYDGFEVVNLFALRSTDPSVLPRLGWAAIGPDNDLAIRQAADRADRIIVGWGQERFARSRALAVSMLLCDRDLYCLGQNQDGSPKHPLYLSAATLLTRFR